MKGREEDMGQGRDRERERDSTYIVSYSRFREKDKMFKRLFDHFCLPAV